MRAIFLCSETAFRKRACSLGGRGHKRLGSMAELRAMLLCEDGDEDWKREFWKKGRLHWLSAVILGRTGGSRLRSQPAAQCHPGDVGWQSRASNPLEEGARETSNGA